MIEIKSPSPDRSVGRVTIFAAGSIEMGLAVNWQPVLCDALKDLDVAVYNPRRDELDSSWEQSAANPQFAEQVNWEVDHIDEADIVFFYFDPATKSIVTFGELYYLFGQISANDERLIVVVCPEGYWRRGNIEVMCERAGVVLHETLDDGIAALKTLIPSLLIEVLGTSCIDGGKCHHGCVDRCFRRECCSPFSDYTGPWRYDATSPQNEHDHD